jgi:hypothetical protein
MRVVAILLLQVLVGTAVSLQSKLGAVLHRHYNGSGATSNCLLRCTGAVCYIT